MSTALKIAGVTLALFLMMGTASIAQDDQPATHGGPIVGDDTPTPEPGTHGGPIVGGDKPLTHPGEPSEDGSTPPPPGSNGGGGNGGSGGGGNGGGNSGSPAETPTEPNPDIGGIDSVPQMSCEAIGWQGGGPMDGVLRNLMFTNTGSGPIYWGQEYVVTTSTGEEFKFVVEITLQPGESETWSNLFPNGVPDDFSCEAIFA